MSKQTVAIIGVGMMGGSLGLAIKKRRAADRVIGIGRNIRRLKRAKNLGACDEVTTDYSEGIKKADLIVICTSLFEIVPCFQKILPYLKSNAVVTDIGSVKTPILEGISQLSTLNSQLLFIGSHPLCGSEKTGAENAQSDLYEGATVVLCALTASSSAPLNRLKKFWQSLGARTLLLQAEIHDILVAQTSHLPHVLASAFVQAVGNLQSHDSHTRKLLAGSFRDLTRIVDSDPRQWSEISSANQKFVVGAIKSYRDILSRLLQKIEKSKENFAEWQTFFSSAKKEREILLPKNQNG